MERALRQCEEVLSGFRKEQPEVLDRFNDVFGTGLPAMWKVNKSVFFFYKNLSYIALIWIILKFK